jgi:hypothetical protein
MENYNSIDNSNTELMKYFDIVNENYLYGFCLCQLAIKPEYFCLSTEGGHLHIVTNARISFEYSKYAVPPLKKVNYTEKQLATV